MENQLLILHRDIAAAHWLVLINDFLSYSTVTTLEYPLLSPDLAGFNFCLFTRMK
jgi:hypothetical protein